jgi:hypothetical protein
MLKKLKYLLWAVVLAGAMLFAIAEAEAQTFVPRKRAPQPAPIALPDNEPPQHTPNNPPQYPTYTPSNIPTPSITPTGNNGGLNVQTLMPHFITLADRYGVWQCIAIVCFIFFLRYLWAERQVKQDSTTFMQNYLNDIGKETNRDVVHLKNACQQLYNGLQQDVQISQRLGDAMNTQFQLLTEAIIGINQKLDKLLEK